MENFGKEYMKMHRDADIYTDTSADYSLPDYNGDIKKVLYTSASVLPATRYNDGEGVTSSGVVAYDILYINSENELDHLSFNSDFDVSAKIGGENILDSDIETRVASFSHRLFGPRRVNMKATLVSEVRYLEGEGLNGYAAVAENPDAECIIKHASVADTRFFRSNEREYAECVTNLDGVIADEVEVLYSSAVPQFTAVRREGEGISVSGSFVVSAVIRCEGVPPTLYKKKIPFDELIEAEGLLDSPALCATANISSLACEIVGSDDGASVNASVIADYSVRASCNRELTFVKDAFLKSAECDNSYGKINYTTHIGTESRVCTVSHTVPISEICECGIRSVVYMNAGARISSLELEDSAARAVVDVKLNGVCSSVDNEGVVNYFAVKTACSATEKVTFNCQMPENSLLDCKTRAIDTVATVDEENLYIDVTYEIASDAAAQKSEEYLVGAVAKEGGEFAPGGSSVRVYYPTPEDSLFTVARKYHTGVEDIAAANMLTEGVMNSFDTPGSLVGVKRLIIK